MTELWDLRDVLIILAAAVVVVPVVRRLNASAVLGYLVAGVLIGPYGLDWINAVERTEVLAELGVVFLLFAVGLELSVDRLLRLRRHVFGLGTAQVLATAVALGGGARALGLSSEAALVLGGGLALSSTAIVLQMLAERGEMAAQHGRLAFAILLLQDLAVVPLLTLVPLLGGSEAEAGRALGEALLRAVVVMGVIVAAGRVLLRPLLAVVARGRNPELFTGIVLLLVLGAGWITASAGLSMGLGAFLAGLLVSSTEYRPQVEGDIRPFRGIFLALFFMTVGMRVDPALALSSAPLVLGLVAALVLGKALLIAALARAFGSPAGVAAHVGLLLAQGGEFGFVLYALAAQAGVLEPDVERIAILVVGISMMVTPLLALAGRRAEGWLAGDLHSPREVRDGTEDLSGHVLIAGFGRVGQTLARLLAATGVPYVALDLDAELVTSARRRGFPAFYGDASQPEVLRAAGFQRAGLAVVTLDQPRSAARAVAAIRAEMPKLPVLVRARDTAHSRELLRAGATQVVPELVEGSLQLGENALRLMGVREEETARLLAGLRRDSYAELSDLIPHRPSPRSRRG